MTDYISYLKTEIQKLEATIRKRNCTILEREEQVTNQKALIFELRARLRDRQDAPILPVGRTLAAYSRSEAM